MSSAAAKKARGGADGLVPTIREYLPWHVIEKKMAARANGEIAADEDDDERTPDSGVYTSGEHRAANDEAFDDVPEGELTYRVYTVADLEARGLAADLSVPSTRMSIVMMAPKPSPWADVGRAALTVLRLAKTWLLAPSPRPALKDAFRAPLVALAFELRMAGKQVAWKKLAFYGGVSLATFLVLLFAVVTAADLTDDLKPSRVATTTSGDSYTTAIVAAQHAPAAAAPPPAVVAPPAAPTGDGLEVSTEPEAPVAPPPRPAAKKRTRGKKKAATNEVFVP